jgi:hypothetical protein
MLQQKLRLEDLQVESFHTSSRMENIGTVEGYQTTGCGQDTCPQTCPDTCWNTCPGTCHDGVPTCKFPECTCNTCPPVLTCKHSECTCPAAGCGNTEFTCMCV